MSAGENKQPFRILQRDEWGLKSDVRKKHTCAYCHQEYSKCMGEIEYTLDKLYFCSYNCRSKYKKERRIKINQSRL